MSDIKQKVFQGGAFLIEDLNGDDILTPDDFTEEQQMIAKTTDDFVEKDVLPKIEQLENHEFDHSVELLKKAGELGLLSADIPEEFGGLSLDRMSSSLITEKISRAGAFSIT